MSDGAQNNKGPEKWRLATLEECADIIRGISFPKDAKQTEPADGYVACLRTTNVQRKVEWDDLWYVPTSYVKRDNQFIQLWDILISTANSYELVGKVSLVSELPINATLGAFISVIRAQSELLPHFLYYQLAWRASQSALRELASTTTNISNISTKKLKTLQVRIAPKPEQQRIVAKIEELFSDLDAGVAALERVQANLQRYRASVLKAAVEGGLTQQWRAEHPDVEPADQLLQRILRERREKWEQDQLAKYEAKSKKPPKNWKDKYKEPAAPDTTNLPELPPGWCWASGDQLFTWASGDFLPAGKMQPGTVPVYGGNGIIGKHDKATVRFRTVVVGRVGAHCGNVHVTAEVARITDNAIYATWVSAEVDLNYLALALSRHDLRRNARGGAQAFLNQTVLKNTLIPLPPLAEQKLLSNAVESCFTVITETERYATRDEARASRLRQAILQWAFEGELINAKSQTMATN
jgi:type I restriction enzyme S subunit